MQRFWVYGLQRSGTNFIEQAVERTYPEWGKSRAAIHFHPSPYWKHSIKPPTDLPTDQPIIIVSKSVHNWIDSIVNRQVMDYLKTQTQYPILDTDYLIKGTTLEVCKPQKFTFSVEQMVKTWNEFHRNWLPLLDTHQAVFIQYEDLLTSKRQHIIQELQTRFELDKPLEFDDSKPARYTQSFNQDRVLQYLHGQWNPLPDQLEYDHIIQDSLDRGVVHASQYLKLGKALPDVVIEDYIDHNQVNQYYLQEIAYRIRFGLPLSPHQTAIYGSNSTQIEALLRR